LGGGLALGGVHDMTAATTGAADAFTALITGRIAEQANAPVLWLERGHSLYAPGLVAFGLPPERLILVSGIARDRDLLWAAEEALQSPALAAVVAEVRVAALTAVRRLQLAAETSGVTAFLLRDSHNDGAGTLTRWRIAAAPSHPNDAGEPGLGHPAWTVELVRCRHGRPGTWTLGWRDGCLHLLADGRREDATLPRRRATG